MGLGLCCEEAARLILSQTEPFRLEIWEPGEETPTDEEAAFFHFRHHYIQTLQNRTVPLAERLPAPVGSPAEWAAFYFNLERLDPHWNDLLKELQKVNQWQLSPEQELPLEQLAVYLIYRHLADGFWEGDLQARIAFTALRVWMIATLTVCADTPLEEVARLYSAEIEYSDENLLKILEKLAKK